MSCFTILFTTMLSTILDIIITQVQDFPFLPSSVHYYCDLKSVDALCICVASKTRSPIVRLLNYLLNRPAVDIHFDEILIYNNLFTISVYFWGSGPLINRFQSNILIYRSGAQKQRLFLKSWMLKFRQKPAAKNLSKQYCCFPPLTNK